jgi:hypothetical protein
MEMWHKTRRSVVRNAARVTPHYSSTVFQKYDSSFTVSFKCSEFCTNFKGHIKFRWCLLPSDSSPLTWNLPNSTRDSPSWEAENYVEPEPEGSSPCSQQAATSPYPEPDESTLYPPPANLPTSTFIPSAHLRLGLPNGLFPSCVQFWC